MTLKRTPLPPRTTALQPGPGPSRRTPLRPAVQDRTGGNKSKSTARTRGRASSARGESFPPAVAALIDARDPWCAHCGTARDLQRHHRRIRGIGGDGREHTHCACNAVRLCRACHLDWAHKERREAGAEGIVIPRSEAGPWRRPLMLHTSADSGVMVWPTCDGRYETEMPEGALAA